MKRIGTGIGKTQSNLVGDRRGAVLAEFAVALVPLFYAFFCFTQFAKIAVATQVMHHATTVAARYAMVSYPACIPHVGAGEDSDLTTAARQALGPFAGSVTVQSVSASYGGGPFGDITTTATYAYNCDVPMGRMICGSGYTHTVSVTFPHSGARYNHAC